MQNLQMTGLPSLSRSLITKLLIGGSCLFLLAFFLPSCGMGAETGGYLRWGGLLGWQCAWVSLGIPLEAILRPKSADNPNFVLLALTAMSGCINLLIPIYLAVSFTAKTTTRRRLAIAILICMVATWIDFISQHLIPLVGHFVWIAGALLILAAEFGVPEQLPAAVDGGA